MKKLIVLLVLISLCTLAFAGGEQEATEGTAEQGEGVVEINFLSNASFPYNEAVPKLVELFEKENPNIKVTVDYNPYRKILEIIELKLSAQEGTPDVFFTDVPLVNAYTVKNYLEPLDEYFSEEEKSDWVGAALEASVVDDRLMTAPLNNSSQLLYYNKDYFDKAGIPYLSKDPKDRITWEELVELAKQLTIDENGDGTPEVFGLGISQVSRPYQMLAMPLSLGGEAISDDGLSVDGLLTSDAWIEAGQFYHDLFNTWKVCPKGVSSSDMTNYFRSGQVAMLIGIDFSASSFVKIDGLNWDYAPYPYFEGGEAVTPTGSWHLGINRYSENKEAAIKWMRFLTTAPNCVEWFKADRHLPPNKNSLAFIESDPMYQEWPFDLYDLAIYESKNTAVPRPLTPGYLEYEQILTNAFEDIRNGADPEKSFADAETRIQRLLLKYK